MKITDPTDRLAKWAFFIQANTFDILNRSGKKHTNVDALSRLLLNIDTPNKKINDIDHDVSQQALRVTKYVIYSKKVRVNKLVRATLHNKQCVIYVKFLSKNVRVKKKIRMRYKKRTRYKYLSF